MIMSAIGIFIGNVFTSEMIGPPMIRGGGGLTWSRRADSRAIMKQGFFESRGHA